ncbi:MAG: hypothetical protein F6K54_31825 [Okeania sp. SIO3B5]|uniref:hypothetical protein n=1 Tax=Okeania sp. SIO3B5 TaxID=2607811 RepID=UPI0013FF880F|nr:hypothetical protein [Okeania sp. SIO3B5]NEO57254.1 hypothetical protein [Okeania sp. SIO3B5]
MSITINLTPELEAQLQEKASQKGQDISLVVSELLARVLEWETADTEEAIKAIQQGLDDFENGRFRSFDEFAEAQRRKYNLALEE